jgi:coniferyl-aldehyde dehydrogenase
LFGTGLYFFPQQRLQEFIHLSKQFIKNNFGTLGDNPDYTSVINQRNHQRLSHYIDNAQASGAEIIPLSDNVITQQQDRYNKLTPTLIINPPTDTLCMQEEIFGPIFPVKTYENINEVIGHINQGERPLALYFFGQSGNDINHIKQKTVSGGMVVNDIAAHVLQDSMPLGGIGHSGMGSYHGFDGFRQLSHPKAFYQQGLLSLTPMFKPPYSAKMQKILEKVMG